MTSQRIGGLRETPLFDQVKHLQMLPAMLFVALSVLHGTVRQQAANTIHATNGFDEKRIARAFDQGFVKANATLVKLISGVGLNAPSQQMQLSGTATRKHQRV